MQHFKEFLIKIQTLDVQIRRSGIKRDSTEYLVSNYDISHENPSLNGSFKTQFKELQALAITDILNLPLEQILNQLQRLESVKEVFITFWEKYYHLPVPIGTEHNLDVIYRMQLNDFFICAELTFMDHAQANDDFIDDLESTIRHRQLVLKEFEQEVLKVINRDKEPATARVFEPTASKIKSRPVFKEGIAGEFFTLLKEYFAESDRKRLMHLLTSSEYAMEPIVFNGAGNQLADAFKQLFDSNLIVGCNKAELESWIQQNFQYRDKGTVKSFTDKYLQDIISSNTKACQSPIFDVRRNGGQFFLSPLTRNNKNSKK